ncbi:MAG: transcriptional regulator, LysR family [Phycisphaerales bacterium]|nr:transcriptional regulator, LysR family [Phycisphaerales bacterium]
MELRHLRYFVAVAEELHFGRAALRLEIAQPPLSRQIQRLEKEIGVQLLARTQRHVELTTAGRAFLERARRVLEQADLAIHAAQRAGRGETGSLAVGFVGSATYGVLPEVLRLFRKRFADVELILYEMGSTAQQRAIVEGRLHLGLIRTPRDNAGLDEALAQQVVQREPLVVALPKGHALTKPETLPLIKLAGEPFILFPREARPSYGDLVLEACAKAGFVPRVTQQTQEMQTAVSLVAAGMGVTLVPDSVRTLRRDNVVYKTIAPPVPISELSAVYRKGDESPVLTAFLGVMGEVVTAIGRKAT